MTARSSADLTVVLDRADARALPIQLADGIRAQVASRALSAGDPLPSSRFLAARLGVSRGTVVAAYEQLAGEGYLLAEQGRPTRVHPGLERIHPPSSPRDRPNAHPTPVERPTAHRFGAETVSSRPLDAEAVRNRPIAEGEGREARDESATGLLDLRPGQPDASRLEGTAWRAAWRHAAAQPLPHRPDPAGQRDLREASAEHLRVMRALPVGAQRLVITAGAREGLGVLLTALSARTGRSRLRVGVESPGYPTLRAVAQTLGHALIACPVDDDGLRVDALPLGEEAPDALIVTPSHQYPLGGSLGLPRRLALLEWAQTHGVLLIEDDFDSELRYVGAPLPTLSALDADGQRVALLGTFSTLLTPALATGYLVPPSGLLEPVLEVRRQLGAPVSAVTQSAVAHLLDSGYLRRHTRRMRSVYARRRTQILAAFAQTRRARLAPMHGGVDVTISTDDDEAQVVRRCSDAGLLVGRQSDYWGASPPPEPTAEGLAAQDRGGIVVGFARADEQVLTRILPLLVAACEGPQPG